MTEEIHGFKKVPIGEHEFAAFLRQNKAINNWHAQGISNTWYGPDGGAVAQCHYDNTACTCTYWLRSDLVTKKMEDRK